MDDFVKDWNIVHHPDNYQKRTDKDLNSMSRYTWQYAGVKAISVGDGYLQSIQCPDIGLIVHVPIRVFYALNKAIGNY